jgi:hypothetical protein
MGKSSLQKAPFWFWIVAILALAWNGLGIMAYLADVYSPESLSATDLQLKSERPAWVTGAFALAVFGSTLGSLLLLFRRGLAKLVFIVSLVAIVAQMTYVLFMSRAIELVGAATAVPMPVSIVLVGILLVWFSGKAGEKKWIG